jgi:hypothetical protein
MELVVFRLANNGREGVIRCGEERGDVVRRHDVFVVDAEASIALVERLELIVFSYKEEQHSW